MPLFKFGLKSLRRRRVEPSDADAPRAELYEHSNRSIPAKLIEVFRQPKTGTGPRYQTPNRVSIETVRRSEDERVRNSYREAFGEPPPRPDRPLDLPDDDEILTVKACGHMYGYAQNILYTREVSEGHEHYLKLIARVSGDAIQYKDRRKRIETTMMLRAYHTKTVLHREAKHNAASAQVTELQQRVESLKDKLLVAERLRLLANYSDYCSAFLKEFRLQAKNHAESIPDADCILCPTTKWTTIRDELDNEDDNFKRWQRDGSKMLDEPDRPYTSALRSAAFEVRQPLSLVRKHIQLYAERNDKCHNDASTFAAKRDWVALSALLYEDKKSLYKSELEEYLSKEELETLKSGIEFFEHQFFEKIGPNQTATIVNEATRRADQVARINNLWVNSVDEKWTQTDLELEVVSTLIRNHTPDIAQHELEHLKNLWRGKMKERDNEEDEKRRALMAKDQRRADQQRLHGCGRKARKQARALEEPGEEDPLEEGGLCSPSDG